jgi:hypothetical protein
LGSGCSDIGENPKFSMTLEPAHLKQSSPCDLGLGGPISEQQTGNQAPESSALETLDKESWSLRDDLQQILPPDGDIEQLKMVFFRYISPVSGDI